MGFMVSPGVQVKELDLTNIIPAVSTSIGAIAGAFSWGPVMMPITIGDEKILTNRFGFPNDTTYKYFMPAAQFLAYASTLKVVRTENEGMLNSTPDGLGVLVKNGDHFEEQTFAAGKEFIARYPGKLGNSIGVLVISSADAMAHADVTTEGYDQLFDFDPGTSDYGEKHGVLNDELHVVIYDKNGAWTGVAGTVLESFQGLSQASDARKEDGTNNYYQEVINTASRYVWAGIASAALPDAGKETDDDTIPVESDGPTYTTLVTPEVYELTGGTPGTSATPSDGELMSAYDVFADPDVIDINLLIGSEADDAVTMANYLMSIATDRKDCVAFVSPAVVDTVHNVNAAQDVKAWADQLMSTSYGVLDSTALYVYDKYNDKYRWTIAAGSVAGLCANTDTVADPWWSPAGYNRGQLRGVTRLAFNPIQNERDTLYKARINPIVTFPGEGTVLFGDKTAQTKPSAFDRINVRRLFIVLEKAIAKAAKYYLFEFNDIFTRAEFRSMVEPFLREVQGRRGLTDFRVVCDETNNTGQVIDTNRFVADIYLKPNRSINFISLNFIAVRTGVEFSEIVGN